MQKRRIALLVMLVGMAGNIHALQPAQCVGNSTFNIGAGIYDITGPAAEVGMMGYVKLGQVTAGISERLWARAFVIESPCNGKRVAIVNTDLGMIFLAVKQEVIDLLQKKYGARYTHDNVLLMATHTHSGPGGFSAYAFYNLSVFGFDRKNFDTIVNGIVAAIERAQDNLQPAHIRINSGTLTDIGVNRSPRAYLLNPPEERKKYASNIDTQMTLLRFDTQTGKPVGLINWFALHGTSMNDKNQLISSDNKGYAEYRFEQDFHSDHGTSAFVAAFAQSNSGDVSPNPFGHEGSSGLAGLMAVRNTGLTQYYKALNLFNHADKVVTGDVDYRHTFVRMDEVKITPEFAGGQWQSTCSPAIGISTLAGSQDGEEIGKQGITCDSQSRTLPYLLCEFLTTYCQGAKPIVLQMGKMMPVSWVPLVLPMQVVRIGQVVIVAVPFELTTMAGRRLRETVAAKLPPEDVVVLATPANAYEHYVTTPEEYQMQRYEGASNHFGPWTSGALQQIYSGLTEALVKGYTVDPGPAPPDRLNDTQINLQTGVVRDATPSDKNFGDVFQDVGAKYNPGDTVSAVFWGAHPKNNYRIMDTFLEVQHFENGEWVSVRRDNDWDTEYHWERKGSAYSLITIVWHLPFILPRGQYRLVHHGDAKTSVNSDRLIQYSGYSSVFNV